MSCVVYCTSRLADVALATAAGASGVDDREERWAAALAVPSHKRQAIRPCKVSIQPVLYTSSLRAPSCLLVVKQLGLHPLHMVDLLTETQPASAAS